MDTVGTTQLSKWMNEGKQMVDVLEAEASELFERAKTLRRQAKGMKKLMGLPVRQKRGDGAG